MYWARADTEHVCACARAGTIELRELAAAVQSLGLSLSPAELRRVFAAMDLDGSGGIDFPEFCASLSGLADQMSTSTAAPSAAISAKQVRDTLTAFNRFDADRSGELAGCRLPADS